MSERIIIGDNGRAGWLISAPVQTHSACHQMRWREINTGGAFILEYFHSESKVWLEVPFVKEEKS